jgi:sensor histidine kinase YesM
VVGHLVLVSRARQDYAEVMSGHFSHGADSAQAVLINYLEQVRANAANLASLAEIRAVVKKSNQQELKQEELFSQIEDIERQWPQMDPERSRFLRNILENPASRFLREYGVVQNTFREVLVTDVHGRLVAVSNKTSDYFQADEKWWRSAYLEGSGNHFISDIQFDESANVYGLEVAEPIIDSDTDTVIGVVKAIADSHELFALVNSIKLGPNVEAVLLRSDGSVIHSPHPTVGYEFEEDFQMATANRLAVEAFEKQAFREDNLHVLVGLPQLRFQDRIPELDWYVVIQGPYDQIFAPFQHINTRFFYILLFSIAVVVGLSLVSSWLVARPVLETDPHLERL